MSFAREPLPKATAIQLFKSLYLARRSEEYIVKHYPENLMRTPMHMSMGQEFVCVAVCAALEGKADVFASYRSHAAFLAQTHDTDRFFSELYGRTSGTGEGKGGSMHLAAPDQGHILSSGVVATQIPVAVGAAFANRQLKTGRTAAVFFGDGACDAGVFWESVNAAALFKLPVLFVCEDNGYAVDTPREARQMSKSLSDAVKPFGADTYDDDSGDVESVYALAKEAAAKAYRDQKTVEHEWIDRDALKVQRARLASHQIGESAIVAMEDEIDRAIQASVKRASQAPIPTPDRLHAGVFHEKA
jgi:TPP-dependent pyruvate/acetoin dehydrogenase alpha subunit